MHTNTSSLKQMPRPEEIVWFDGEIIPMAQARVSIEAGLSLTWKPYLGDAGRSVSIEHYGASGKGTLLFKQFGLTADAVVAAAKESMGA